MYDSEDNSGWISNFRVVPIYININVVLAMFISANMGIFRNKEKSEKNNKNIPWSK